jgi:hypothetical protein
MKKFRDSTIVKVLQKWFEHNEKHIPINGKNKYYKKYNKYFNLSNISDVDMHLTNKGYGFTCSFKIPEDITIELPSFSTKVYYKDVSKNTIIFEEGELYYDNLDLMDKQLKQYDKSYESCYFNLAYNDTCKNKICQYLNTLDDIKIGNIISEHNESNYYKLHYCYSNCTNITKNLSSKSKIDNTELQHNERKLRVYYQSIEANGYREYIEKILTTMLRYNLNEINMGLKVCAEKYSEIDLSMVDLNNAEQPSIQKFASNMLKKSKWDNGDIIKILTLFTKIIKSDNHKAYIDLYHINYITFDYHIKLARFDKDGKLILDKCASYDQEEPCQYLPTYDIENNYVKLIINKLENNDYNIIDDKEKLTYLYNLMNIDYNYGIN